MIGLALNRGIDLILTKSVSRFARNTLDTLQTVRQLKDKGVEVIFEKENIHTLDPNCEVVLTIMSSLAQEESRSLSENTRWGIHKSMKDGNVKLPYKRFLGYEKGPNGRPEIVEEEAETIRSICSIYNLYLNGNSISQVARIMTERHILTPGGKTTWRANTIRSILSNEKYKGEALLQKTYAVDFLSKKVRRNKGERKSYLVHHSHEPIIDPSVYERVQRELIRRRTVRTKRTGVGSPFINRLICGDCGAFYGHKVWRSRGKAHTRLDVWCCNHRYTGEQKCATPILRENEIKAAFARVLYELERSEQEYSDALWYELVEEVAIHENRLAEFRLADGNMITVSL